MYSLWYHFNLGYFYFSIGSFKPTQLLDVIGQVADNKNPTMSYLQIINTMSIQFFGSSDPIPKKRKPKYNPGNLRDIFRTYLQMIELHYWPTNDWASLLEMGKWVTK